MDMSVSATQVISALRFREIKPVLQAFDFPYAVIKGEALSLLAYGKLGQRTSGDIDLLLSKENTKKAALIFEQYNFYRTNRSREHEILMRGFSHQITPYGKITGLVYTEIDINHDILWGEYAGDKTSIDDFLSDAIEISLYNCNTFSLSPIKAFIQLLLHQYRDMNSIYLLAARKKLNISAFRDIFYLLKNNINTIPLKELYDLCDRLQVIPYIYYVLYYTNIVFPDAIIQSYMHAFETEGGIELLNCYGLTNEERKTWKCDFRTRLNSDDIFQLIQCDLTAKDLAKVEYNKTMLSRKEKKNEK